MCGIIGVFHSAESARLAHQALAKIPHRGGSNFELKSFGDCTIGANRLPIVDRASGTQPKANQAESIFAVQNGEIFNHKELRAELTQLGHVFRTESDTEILPHLYERYGVKMMEHLDSEMFAFIIYDAGCGDVFAARDPLGVKPFHYAKDAQGALFFASELKQLSQFDFLTEIHEFPPGHYYYQGKFRRYFSLGKPKKMLSEEAAIRQLERQLVAAVRKRVETDLPVGVFLSGGVDSSLVMEIATRFHADVTALILGYEGSSDYEHAVRLCKERHYKYHVITPHVDYAAELDDLLYALETYEPLVVRQSFANWLCSREAQRLGLSVVLVGEGADELFAGYNEFSALPADKINEGCRYLTEHLAQGHLKRVDRASMHFTVEVRSPFLDTAVVQTAFRIPGHLKIDAREHRITTKYILRKVAERFLPAEIAWRYKMPFANGAGMNVGYNFKSGDGDVAAVAGKRATSLDKKTLKKYGLETAEEQYYFQKYQEFGFDKLAGDEQRIVIKDTLHSLSTSRRHRLVVAEFDKLALYFPVYFAAQKKFFELHGLEVDFIATGGDDNTYSALLNNSAQIGLADPLFAMFDGMKAVGKGEIFGELVHSTPIVAVALNPAIRIDKPDDLLHYKLGSFQKYSTTHTVVQSLLPTAEIHTCSHRDVIAKLVDRSIDIALVLAEFAIDLEARGGRILYEFAPQMPHYLFTGFTHAGSLEPRHKKKLPSFTAAVRESLRYMVRHPEEAVKAFHKLFPEIEHPEKVIDYYRKFWIGNLKVVHEDYLKSHAVWKRSYPEILKQHEPYFKGHSPADAVLEVINSRHFRREYPFLEDRLKLKIERQEPLHFVGFWGASSKTGLNRHDTDTITHLYDWLTRIQAVYAAGAKVTFLLADFHARNNGYREVQYLPYLKEVQQALHAKGLSTLWLSELWEKWEVTAQNVEKQLTGKKPGWWNSIGIATNLEHRAAKNFAGHDARLGAQKYHVMRKIEKPCLEKEFRDAVFLVYGDSTLQSLYPKIPTVYLWTEKGGFSNCPWFM